MFGTNMIRQLVKQTLVKSLWCTLGRRDLVRLGRFLSNESRLDGPNEMQKNGEGLVQRFCLEHFAKEPQSVVFDVGANVGLWSRSLLEQAPRRGVVQVHAFEPCLETFDTLRSNLDCWRHTDRVVTNRLALSAAPGSMNFYSYGQNAGRNSVYAAGGRTQTVCTVPVETIDRYCQQNAIDRVVLIKIDTEGHDFEVLQGAREMLQKQRVDLIQFEYNCCWVDARHYLKDAFSFVAPFGYSIGKITRLGIEFYTDWHFELETFREANFLITRTSAVSLFPRIRWWNDPA